MCETEQDKKRYLCGYALELADKAGCVQYCLSLLEVAVTLPQYERIVEEMESRVAHKRLTDEMIGGWYERLDKRGGYSGD